MGNDTGQWRAAIGSFCESSSRRRYYSRNTQEYPYSCGAVTDPNEIQRAITQGKPTASASNSNTSRISSGKRKLSTKPITDFFRKKLKTTSTVPSTDGYGVASVGVGVPGDSRSNASPSPLSSGTSSFPTEAVAGVTHPLSPSCPDERLAAVDEVRQDASAPAAPPPGEVEAYHKFDIGNFVNPDLPIDDLTKFQLLKSTWCPDKVYKFPFSTHTKGGKEIRQYASMKHLKTYEWLAFSHAYRGYFCKYCVLFSQDASNADKARNTLGALVKSPVTRFSKLTGADGCLTRHSKCTYHKHSLLSAANFKKTYKSPQLIVTNQLSSQRASQVEENRRRLRPIVETIVLCGRQDIPLRGHRDDGRLDVQSQATCEPEPSIVSINDGNFRALLRYRIAGGDKTLADHLSNAGANATYIGKNTQNELIKCCGDEVASILCDRIRKAKWFSIIFDETTDVSRKEQMSLSVRYIHNKQIREDFLAFVDCYASMRQEDIHDGEKKLTGVALAHIVIDVCQKLGLDLNYLVGIGTDNCSVMASDFKGAVQEIRKFAPLSVRCPCMNHSLNNSLKQCNNIISCKSAHAKMKEVIAFAHSSAKITDVFRRVLDRSFSGLCETRWQEKHDGVLQFRTALPLICDALEEITAWSSDTASRAHSLMLSLMTSDFIISTFVLSDVLAVTRPLSLLLQTKSLDSVRASDAVQDVIGVLQKKREMAETEFRSLFQAAKEAACDLDVVISPPRTARRQRYRDNTPAVSAEEYYRRSLYIPLLDITLQDLRSRLSQEVLDSFDLRMLMPRSQEMQSASDIPTLSSDTKDKLAKIMARYGRVLDPSASLMIGAEFSLWVEKWRRQSAAAGSSNADSDPEHTGAVPSTVLAVLDECDESLFPTINTLLKILATLPISVATAERSFSTLRRMKTWLRSTGCALLVAHGAGSSCRSRLGPHSS